MTSGTGNVTTNSLQLLGGLTSGSNFVVSNAAANVVTVTGNVSATTYFGDGSKLSGVLTSVSNLQQTTAGTGNVTVNNLQLLGGLTSGSNFVVSNVASNVVTVTGNVSASGYLFGDGSQITNLPVSNLQQISSGTGNVTMKKKDVLPNFKTCK